ncbi:hypothetical protein ACROYT_G028464 [Oculina patagonica]
MRYALMVSCCLSIRPFLEGVIKFTLEPSDPSYAWKGSNARLVWDYNVDDKQKELLGIGFYVLVSNRPFLGMLVQFKNGTVAEHSQLPAAYRGRVMIEGNASLIIENVSAQDNTRFMCRLFAELGADHESVVQLIVTDPAKILNITLSAASSWIGQTVTLKCVSDGVPTPTLTWYKPDRNELNTVTAKESTIDVTINSKQDFGEYKCAANNGLDPLSDASLFLRQIEKPGSPVIVFSSSDIQATSLTVKWTAPADDGGSPITAYRVVILKGGTEIRNENVTDPGKTICLLEVRQGSGDSSCCLSQYHNLIGDNHCYNQGYQLEKASNSRQLLSSRRQMLSQSKQVKLPAQLTRFLTAVITCRFILQQHGSWEIRREQVNIIKNIGNGAFSQVAKATANNFHNNQDVTVAVKMLKENAPDSDRKDLLSELELMKKLKPHPHVIKLLGCVTETDPILVLIEYVPYGDLLGYLKKSRGLNDTYFNNPDRKPKTNLTSQQLMRFAWQIADGMTYLSSRKIIHRDLAARNVLVGEGEKCKVTDFGMARNVHQDDIYTKQSRGRLPVKWTAYEALLYGTYTTQSDVWSYGVLLYEILTIEGVIKFTLEPSDPSYARKGSNARLVWDYNVDDKQKELLGIGFYVLVSNRPFLGMLVQFKNGTVAEHSQLPAAYRGRVRMEGNASLIIENVSAQDNTRFMCRLFAELGADHESEVQLIVTDPAKILNITLSAASSWIGQTVTLKCVSDGVPTPTITWYKPDRNELNTVTAKESTIDVTINSKQDFGEYKCVANNGLDPLSDASLFLRQIEKPGSPVIVFSSSDIQATSLTVKWTAPADDGGSPITAYRVVILKGGTEIRNENVTDPVKTSLSVGGLDRDTEYTVKVFARNAVFESAAAQRTIRTKIEGIPDTPETINMPAEVQGDEVALKWTKPVSNGADITQYTVYIRNVSINGTVGDWRRLEIIHDVSVREYVVTLKKGQRYEFVVTATNKYGESLKEKQNIKRIKVLGGSTKSTTHQNDTDLDKLNEKRKSHMTTITKYCPRRSDDGVKKQAETVRRPQVNLNQHMAEGIAKYLRKRRNRSSASSGEETVTSPELKRLKDTETIFDNKNDDVEETNNVDVDMEALEKIGAISNQLDSILARLENLIDSVRQGSGDSSCCLSQYHNLIGDNHCYNQCYQLEKASNSSGSKSSSRADLTDSIQMVHTTVVQQEADVKSIKTSEVTSTTYEIPHSSDYMPLHPSTRSWEIRREQVNIIKNIGNGAFSQVARATAKNFHNNQDVTVAVKMLKENAPDSDRKDLLSELELMKKLKPHPHVIKLLGCVTETDPLLVLIEYVPYGDLLGYLRKSRGLNDTYFNNPDRKPKTKLTSQQLMRFAWQIADGMTYLSSRKIIHRDLAARNVLVGEGEKCKVTDFGMARNVHQDDIYTKQSRGRLPVKWTAYEALLYGTYTTQSDVWSYGVLLYEILTIGGSPYPGINARQIATKLQEGFRMPKPKHVDSKIYQIMLNCWEQNPSDRPTFPKIKETMKGIERNHKTYINLDEYDNSLYANMEDLTAE